MARYGNQGFFAFRILILLNGHLVHGVGVGLGEVKDHGMVADEVSTRRPLLLIDVLLLFFIETINEVLHAYGGILSCVDERFVGVDLRIELLHFLETGFDVNLCKHDASAFFVRLRCFI